MGDVDRFMRHVDVNPYACWTWSSGLYPNGYGKFKLATGTPGGRAVLAHRWIYQHYYGEIKNVINHICEIKNCVNPLHLDDVTQLENVRYSLSDYCLRGHNLNDEDVYVEKNGKRHCQKCVSVRLGKTPSNGDIGEKEERKYIELEPIKEPVHVPQPEPEKVDS